MGSVRNSVKSVTNAVTSVPNNIIHTVDSVMDGITKALQVLCDTAAEFSYTDQIIETLLFYIILHVDWNAGKY